MKRNLLIMLLFTTLCMMPAFALNGNLKYPNPPHHFTHNDNFHREKPMDMKPPVGKDFKEKKELFEKRLKLTPEQKVKAKEIRENGIKEMRPVMNAIKAKQDELKIALSIPSEEKKKEEVEKIQNDLYKLRKKAREIKMKNMKEFETILTEEQAKTFHEMKEEGRKSFLKKQKKLEKKDNNKKPALKNKVIEEK